MLRLTFLLICYSLLGGCVSAASRPLLFQAQRPSDSEDLYSIDVDTGVAHRLTRGSMEFANGLPTWSPTAREIAFVRERFPRTLFILSYDFGRLRELTTPALPFLGPPAWSPDGSEILIAAGIDLDHRRLYRIRADGSGFVEMNLPDGMFDCGSYSPAGDRIVSSRAFGSRSEVVIADLDGRLLETLASSDTTEFHCAEWSPVGDSVGITEYANDLSWGRLAIIDTSDGQVSVIPTGSDYANAFKWSPDGSMIAYQCTESEAPPSDIRFLYDMEICIIRPDGSGRKQLTDNAYFDGHPSW